MEADPTFEEAIEELDRIFPRVENPISLLQQLQKCPLYKQNVPLRNLINFCLK